MEETIGAGEESPPASGRAAAGSRGVFGLIAGGGTFPFEVARAARARGFRVICAGVRHEVDPAIAAEVDEFVILSVGRLGATMRYLKRHGVRELSWAGWVRKERLFKRGRWMSIWPDWRMLRLWFFVLRDRQSQTILASIAAEFEKEGLHLTHSAKHCPELLVPEGLLSRRSPTAKELDDIRFGWSIAQRMADLDVGQSVAVFEKTTIAVEGIEGTDRNIRRAGELCKKGGFTVVKLAKKGHDMRFDVPTVGAATIETLHAAGGRVLAIEAERTLVLEREDVAALADRHGICVVAYREPPA